MIRDGHGETAAANDHSYVCRMTTSGNDMDFPIINNKI